MSYRYVIASKYGGTEVFEVHRETTLSQPAASKLRKTICAVAAVFTIKNACKEKYLELKTQPSNRTNHAMVGVVDKLGVGGSQF